MTKISGSAEPEKWGEKIGELTEDGTCIWVCAGKVSEDILAYDALIRRLSGSKTAPGTPWWRFWLAYDRGMFFFGLSPRRAEIEDL